MAVSVELLRESTKLNEYKYTDYFDEYEHIMQFNKNKNKYIHGWYPFVEGYSKEFIRSIVEEQHPLKPTYCLEPFAGSGTTPVELQKLNIKCISFEVNPFMHNLATTKMRTDYTVRGLKKNLSKVIEYVANSTEDIETIMPPPIYRKITDDGELEKWNLNKEVLKGILDIRYALTQLSDTKYKELFKIGLASILLEVSNMYRNGKCLSYKRNWKENVKLTRSDVHQIFQKRIESVFLPDIVRINKYKREEQNKLTSNYSECILGDCLEKIDIVKDDSIDLVITSPPYLNSRDYTDSYMLELWTLGYVNDYGSVRELRENTLRSHVQLKWGDVETLEIEELQRALSELLEYNEELWNNAIPGMIKGYFIDLDILFKKLYKKMMINGKIYFNVANSAYYGVEIKTDIIVSKIAENHGFKILEIRKARKLNPSAQQKDKIPFLLEVVIVMIKEAS